MTIVCYDSNVNGMRPGDRVEIIGIYRSQQKKMNRGKLDLEAVYHTYCDLISFNVIEENKFKTSLVDYRTIFDDDDKEMFH